MSISTKETGWPGISICIEIGIRLLMLPHSRRDFISHSIPSKVYSGIGNYDINSKRLCVILTKRHGWDPSSSYRVPGVIIPEKHMAVFDLSKAEKLPGV